MDEFNMCCTNSVQAHLPRLRDLDGPLSSSDDDSDEREEEEEEGGVDDQEKEGGAFFKGEPLSVAMGRRRQNVHARAHLRLCTCT